ncbi:MAG: CCA tRNA nucleotidyltransferase [Oscillochloris sp.]|nr:CCA tRNA nucleotidyltransferase [Oscillochloris sp.]
MREPSLLLDALPVSLRGLLAQAAAVGAAHNAQLWMVGGIIRDLMLGVPFGRDIDLAVEGDVAALADELAAALGGRLIARHDAFGTASLQAGAHTFDLARTRVEHYPRPAMLPEVAPAPIEADLIRRDFSVNAIALALLPDNGALRAGPIFDPFDGRADLSAGRLRLLHEASLRDDPTRLLRGLRLAARLRFTPDPASQAQIQAALAAGYLQLLTPERILGELCLALEEPAPNEVLALADTWGVTPQILPGLQSSAALQARCARFRIDTEPPLDAVAHSLIWLGLLMYDLSPAERATIARRYPLPSGSADLLHQLDALQPLLPDLERSTTASAITRLLRPFGAATIAVLHYAEPGGVGLAAAAYLRHLRHIRAPLDGNDLRRLGVAPGPAMGRLLDELRSATLDGLIAGRSDAETWVRRRLEEPLL